MLIPGCQHHVSGCSSAQGFVAREGTTGAGVFGSGLFSPAEEASYTTRNGRRICCRRLKKQFVLNGNSLSLMRFNKNLHLSTLPCHCHGRAISDLLLTFPISNSIQAMITICKKTRFVRKAWRQVSYPGRKIKLIVWGYLSAMRKLLGLSSPESHSITQIKPRRTSSTAQVRGPSPVEPKSRQPQAAVMSQRM